MHKLTRLEIICLGVTLLIVAVMVANVTLRKNAGQEWDPNQGDEELAAGSSPGASANGVHGGATDTDPADPQSSSDPTFTERARQLPNPASAAEERPATIPSTNGVQAGGPLPKSTVFGTNEVMKALERIAAMPWSPASEQLLQETITKWASSDPTAALQYAMQIESRRVRSALLSGIFNSWAKSDVNGAYSWLLANRESDPGTFQTGLKPVFSALAAQGIDGAMKMALGIPSGTDRLSAMRIVVEQATRSGSAPSMASYLEILQTPGEKQSYASMVAQNWALYAPQDAAQWALSLTDPALQKTALASTVGAWANDNPQAAADWVLTLPGGELKSRQIAQVTQSWARYDPASAADWLLSQRPPSPSLDPAVQGLVNTVMRSNPEGAVMWAAIISDPKARNSAIVNASREWMRYDPPKASAYIMTAPLSPAQRARLLKGR